MATNEKLIWDLCMKEIGNAYGVAGLMGNLMAESSLNPLCKTGGKSEIKKLTGLEYAQKVMIGQITPYDFAHDGVAFGLVQWAYYSRKEALFDYIRRNYMNIGSIEGQVGYMLEELPKYKAVWKTLKNAKSIGEASDIVLLKYEKPKNTSDKVKAKRALYAQGYYEKYAIEPVKEVKRLSNGDILDILYEIEGNELFTSVALHDKFLLVIAEMEERAKENSQC